MIVVCDTGSVLMHPHDRCVDLSYARLSRRDGVPRGVPADDRRGTEAARQLIAARLCSEPNPWRDLPAGLDVVVQAHRTAENHRVISGQPRHR